LLILIVLIIQQIKVVTTRPGNNRKRDNGDDVEQKVTIDDLNNLEEEGSTLEDEIYSAESKEKG
jgi:hypothetical protein